MPINAARLEMIDGRLVFQGMDTLPSAADLTPLHLPQIEECDLPPGEYQWIESRATFERIPSKFKKASVMNVADQTALALTVYALHQAGVPLAQEVRDWFNAWINTVDAGSVLGKYNLGAI